MLAKNRGWSKIIVKNDSSTVIEACKRIPSPLCIQDLIADISESTRRLSSVSFSFVRRDANRAAHVLGRKFIPDTSFRGNIYHQIDSLLSSLPF